MARLVEPEENGNAHDPGYFMPVPFLTTKSKNFYIYFIVVQFIVALHWKILSSFVPL